MLVRPVLGRSLGIENGNSFQYVSLENSMDRGAWPGTVHGVAKNCTQLKRLSTHTRIVKKQLVHRTISVSTGFSPVHSNFWF